jgi:hypothetical protein
MTRVSSLGYVILTLGLFALGLHLGYKTAWDNITKLQVVSTTKADRK